MANSAPDPVTGAAPAPFYLRDVAALRAKLERAEQNGSRLGTVWASVRRRAQAAPEQFPWFVPFVALITRREQDIEAARQTIRRYVATFEAQPFGMGLQFHFWCFAFPHARWSLYFQWLDSIGAWAPEEARKLRAELLSFQFLNFFYGLRTKPEPECVDNQALSLCFSNALLGHLFGQTPHESAMARRMFEDGFRRLPAMLGGMPPSGYSGEGSTYMDYVVGPCIPFVVEFLEAVTGDEWFTPKLAPNDGSAAAIVEMIAREWLPNGLLLPWDHYGYSLPVRSCIAYGAHRTGASRYFDLLENVADWGHEISIGWGYDDLIWTLIWWPDRRPATQAPTFPSWVAPEVGAALVSDDARLHLMQMWDETTPGYPTRAHVNPNAVTLTAYGSPLTTDGVATKECSVFNFADTSKEISNCNFTPFKTNYGQGCAGAHSVLLVDGWEGMRATRSYRQAELIEFDTRRKMVTADVTPLYRERWADVRQVRRRSRLCAERFWLIEDLAVFEQMHQYTARWFLRPHQIPAAQGVAIETAEGVRLQLLPLVGPDAPELRTIPGYPDRLDGESLVADFHQSGTICRWLWLGWPEATRGEMQDVSAGWTAVPDPHNALNLEQACQALADSALTLPLTLPAFMLADVPVVKRWWYRRTIQAPATGPWWLRLPRQLRHAQMWANGRELDLLPHALCMELLPPEVAMPADLRGEIELVLCTDCGISQYGREDRGGSGFSGRPAILVPETPATLAEATYCAGRLSVRSGDRRWTIEHTLLATALP